MLLGINGEVFIFVFIHSANVHPVVVNHDAMFLEAIKTIVTMLNMHAHKNGIYTQRDTHARTH